MLGSRDTATSQAKHISSQMKKMAAVAVVEAGGTCRSRDGLERRGTAARLMYSWRSGERGDQGET